MSVRSGLCTVAVLGIAGLVLASCGDDTDSDAADEAAPIEATSTTEAAPTEATEATPTEATETAPTEVTATAAATPAAPSELPSSLCCQGIELTAGSYRLPSYWVAPLVADIGEGWRAIYEAAASLVAFAQGENEVGVPSRWLYLIRTPAGLDAQGVIDAMAVMGTEGAMTIAAGPDPADIAGFSGFFLDATANDNPEQVEVPGNGIEAGAAELGALENTGYFARGFQMTSATRQSQLRFVTLDIDGRTLLALIDAPPAEFDVFAAEASSVLASLRIAAEA